MKKFNSNLAYFFIPIIILYSFLVYWVWFINTDGKATFEILYKYQVSKIDTVNFETVFIGDSSLGNAINAKVISDSLKENCVNLALTGVYGFEGSYNMLKKVIAKKNGIKNVILMFTLDMYSRPVSYSGYANTMTLADFKELPFLKKMNIINEIIDCRDIVRIRIDQLFNKPNKLKLTKLIEDDYIIQGNKKNFKGKGNSFNKLEINNKKTFFLQKIVDLCRDKNINLIYVNGPIHDEIFEKSDGYIGNLNNKLASFELNYIPEIVTVTNEHLGDNQDHISPQYKQIYTLKYYSLIRPYLKH